MPRRPRLPTSYLSAIPAAERAAAVRDALRRTAGAKKAAAKYLECPYWYFERVLEQLGLKDEPARVRAEFAARYRLPARRAASPQA
jgi:hypothetical protein